MIRKRIIHPSRVDLLCMAAHERVGVGEAEALMRIVIDFGDFLFGFPVSDIIVLNKVVTVTHCELFAGKAQISGVLRKNLLIVSPFAPTVPSLTPSGCRVTPSLTDVGFLVLLC